MNAGGQPAVAFPQDTLQIIEKTVDRHRKRAEPDEAKEAGGFIINFTCKNRITYAMINITYKASDEQESTLYCFFRETAVGASRKDNIPESYL